MTQEKEPAGTKEPGQHCPAQAMGVWRAKKETATGCLQEADSPQEREGAEWRAGLLPPPHLCGLQKHLFSKDLI